MSSNQRIAFPSLAPGGLQAQVTSRFGRCEFFTIVELENQEISEVKIVKNEGINAMGGAGPMATQLIANEQVNIVVGGNYGPNAAYALQQAGIELFGSFPGTVSEVLQAFQENKIPQVSNATVGSHTGMGRGGGNGRGGGQGRGQGSGRGRNF